MITQAEYSDAIREISTKILATPLWQGSRLWTLADLAQVADPHGDEGGMKATTMADRLVTAVVRCIDDRQRATDMLAAQARHQVAAPNVDTAAAARLARGIVRLMDANGWADRTEGGDR